ncbi:MAG: class I SAM-dependent methyltransferase [Gemmatimonadales bacterium]
MSAFADHFSGQAGAYAAHRPSYPPGLIQQLASLCAGRALAWDAGTGSGQAAVLLGEHFQRVLATDASAEQIRHAQAHPRVEYRVARAEHSALPDQSADLVTVAQALHWFDLPQFYAEVRRVLRPGGIVAAWCYGNPTIDPEVDPVVERFYTERVGRYWSRERRHVEAGYRDLPFPFEELPAADWALEAKLTREEFLGYVATWSAVAAARKAEDVDPILDFGRDLMDAWPEGSRRRVIRWPVSLRIGRC